MSNPAYMLSQRLERELNTKCHAAARQAELGVGDRRVLAGN